MVRGVGGRAEEKGKVWRDDEGKRKGCRGEGEEGNGGW